MYNIPVYLDVVSSIKEYIVSQHLEKGDKLPSEKEFMAMFHTSRTTLRRALQILEEENIIVKKQGRGTFLNITPTTQPFTKIAALLPNFSQLFGKEYLYCLSTYSFERAIEFNYFFYDETTESKSDYLLNTFLRKSDGVIIWPQPENESFLTHLVSNLTSLNIPIVLVNRNLSHTKALNFVATDNKKAIKLALNHLLNFKHSEIALCTRDNKDDTSLISRVENYKIAIQEKGLNFNLCILENDLPEISLNNKKLLSTFLNEHLHVSAFIVTEYTTAVLLYESLIELNYRVPEDYSILCFDFTHDFANKIPVFTHIKQDEKRLAHESLEILLKQIEDPKSPPEIKLLSSSLVKGQTVLKNPNF